MNIGIKINSRYFLRNANESKPSPQTNPANANQTNKVKENWVSREFLNNAGNSWYLPDISHNAPSMTGIIPVTAAVEIGTKKPRQQRHQNAILCDSFPL